MHNDAYRENVIIGRWRVGKKRRRLSVLPTRGELAGTPLAGVRERGLVKGDRSWQGLPFVGAGMSMYSM